MPINPAILQAAVGNLPGIVGGILGGGQKFFLHMPDGNPNGLGVAAPEGSAGPPAPVALPEAQGPSGLPANSQGEAGSAGTPMTPLETTPSGKPLTWVGSNDAPGAGNVISWAIAQYNYQSDAQTAAFKGPFPAAFVPLVKEAFAEWASLANIKPVQVNDVSSSPPQPPDIRVGLSDLLSNIGPPMVGFTHPKFDANGKFSPDTLVSIENPTQMPVIALSNGDFQYKGFDTTVLQVALHEVGHALGLAENPNDPTSIMNPSLTRLNRAPDAQDIAAIRYLYGPPSANTV